MPPLTPRTPQSASEYHARQQREAAAAVAAVRRLWRRMGGDFDASFARLLPQMLAVISLAQERMATRAQGYIPDVLEDTGQISALDAAGPTRIAPLIGVAGDGRPVDSLLYGGVIRAKGAVGAGMTSTAAVRSVDWWITTSTSTALSDTARQSEALGMGVRPVSGYVRVLAPPSCSRCVVLAGKRYASNKGFQRHNRCDCYHIPASEALAGELTLDPAEYFDSLTAAEQDATFTKAGAEAIRNGADVGQVVNARRGMNVSQSRRLVRDQYGVYTTTSGTAAAARAARKAGRPVPIRLMPESIAELAHSKDDYLRLLRAYGYLL